MCAVQYSLFVHSGFDSFIFGEHLDELFVVDQSVAVDIGAVQHLVGVNLGQLHLPVTRHDVPVYYAQ